jgi:hypothetical protein
MRKKRWKSYWSDGLSIDETRFSVIVVLTVIGFIYTLYAHYKTGDITMNLLTLIQTLIYGIIGINGMKFISDTVVRKREEESNRPDYNDSAGGEQYPDSNNKEG